MAAAALAGLPGVGSARLGRLLELGPPRAVWQALVADDRRALAGLDVAPPAVEAARRTDLGEVARRLRDGGIEVTTAYDPRHPAVFVEGPDPAPVVFWRGGVGRRRAPHVAVVGTRRCTPTGREFAAELGAALAAAGVVVVSGLALGIDGAAHRGALAAGGAPPVAVVGSGVDVPYPRRHDELWARVARRGSLLSEAPPGAAPEAWRFPARNRLIVALADLVVVVESRVRGGSMHTVEHAIRRGVEVMAVPGSVRNPAAAGTNRLLAEGCAPVCDPDDVLVALGLLAEPGPASPPSGPGTPADDPAAGQAREIRETGESGPDGEAAAVLGALDDGPCALDTLAARTGLSPPVLVATVERLVTAGRVARDGARFAAAGRRSGS
ncbi:MAG: DNA-protecting protein DprA [Actinomyces sp.]|nr:MAG: DNA-protecting protein DprA [Actinomyces sp.]